MENKEEFDKFYKYISIESGSETLVVLNGHLLLEDLMMDCCHSKVANDSALRDAKLGFLQLLHLCRANLSHTPQSWVVGGLKKMNSLRNKLAHNLEPDDYKKARDEFVALIRSHSGNKSKYAENIQKHKEIALAITDLYIALLVYLKFKPLNVLQLLARGAK